MIAMGHSLNASVESDKARKSRLARECRNSVVAFKVEPMTVQALRIIADRRHYEREVDRMGFQLDVELSGRSKWQGEVLETELAACVEALTDGANSYWFVVGEDIAFDDNADTDKDVARNLQNARNVILKYVSDEMNVEKTRLSTSVRLHNGTQIVGIGLKR